MKVVILSFIFFAQKNRVVKLYHFNLIVNAQLIRIKHIKIGVSIIPSFVLESCFFLPSKLWSILLNSGNAFAMSTSHSHLGFPQNLLRNIIDDEPIFFLSF